MISDFQTLSPEDRLNRAVELVLAGSQQDFPVVENEEVVGILTRDNMIDALSRLGKDASISEVMRQDFQSVEATEMLQSAFARLQECECHTMPVLSHGKLIGLLTMENVGEFMMIHSALKKSAMAIRA
jgi:predicted transcriptional regulator